MTIQDLQSLLYTLVHDWLKTPGPKYSRMRPVPPRTVSFPAICRIRSFVVVHLLSSPVNCIPSIPNPLVRQKWISYPSPTTCGAFNSQGVPVIASTASAPPTPIAKRPRPPALGVCESINTSQSTFNLPRQIVYLFQA